MEHLNLTGGEQYLAFARSRIKAMRATGLRYASQKFDMGDATVMVRIVLEHAYIDIVGEAKVYVGAVCPLIDFVDQLQHRETVLGGAVLRRGIAFVPEGSYQIVGPAPPSSLDYTPRLARQRGGSPFSSRNIGIDLKPVLVGGGGVSTSQDLIPRIVMDGAVVEELPQYDGSVDIIPLANYHAFGMIQTSDMASAGLFFLDRTGSSRVFGPGSIDSLGSAESNNPDGLPGVLYDEHDNIKVQYTHTAYIRDAATEKAAKDNPGEKKYTKVAVSIPVTGLDEKIYSETTSGYLTRGWTINAPAYPPNPLSSFRRVQCQIGKTLYVMYEGLDASYSGGSDTFDITWVGTRTGRLYSSNDKSVAVFTGSAGPGASIVLPPVTSLSSKKIYIAYQMAKLSGGYDSPRIAVISDSEGALSLTKTINITLAESTKAGEFLGAVKNFLWSVGGCVNTTTEKFLWNGLPPEERYVVRPQYFTISKDGRSCTMYWPNYPAIAAANYHEDFFIGENCEGGSIARFKIVKVEDEDVIVRDELTPAEQYILDTTKLLKVNNTLPTEGTTLRFARAPKGTPDEDEM